MKTNKFMRIASVLLVAVVLTTCAISGTFAKYTSEATVVGSATVAKWSFEVEGEEIAVTGDATSVNFDLFETFTDDNVKGKLLAPGTTGSFTIDCQNKSEVTAEYTITFEATNTSSIPVEYSVDGKDGWSKDISTLNVSTTTAAMNASAATTHTFYWRWDFSSNGDANDTALGIDAPSMTVTATVTANQVD